MMRYRLLVIGILMHICLAGMGQVGELPRSTPEAEGVSDDLMTRFHQAMTALPNVDIHHIMVLRHGKVISEYHALPYQADDLHTLYSASKTVTALAVGLAIDDGLLTVNDKVSKYLRDKMPATLTPALDSLTIRHMLMMAAGREQDQSIPEGDDEWLTTWFKGNFSEVGQHFVYDSMCTHALAVIVTRVTGKPMLQYVRERIFEPLHIVQADWELAPDSVETAGWGLRLHAESEAKLGQLMLQGGVWNGQRLLSEQWIHDMTQMHLGTDVVPQKPKPLWKRFMRFLRRTWHTVRSWFTGYNIDDYFRGYGYQTKAIMQPHANSFFAAGYGGQLIDVVPDLDLVVVINGRAANYGNELNAIYEYLVVPLVRGKHEPAVAGGFSYDLVPPQGEATHPSESRLFDGRIVLEENELGINSIEVTPDGERQRDFTIIDQRRTLHAHAACGQWRITTSDELPIYIMECRHQLVGTPRPFKNAAAYAWQGDTLVMRLEWIDGGDNRNLRMAMDGNRVTVFARDNTDLVLTDTIHGTIQPRR